MESMGLKEKTPRTTSIFPRTQKWIKEPYKIKEPGDKSFSVVFAQTCPID